MTCDKCFHNEVCTALYEMNDVPRIGATECAYFKDKERVVEVVPVENFTGRMHGDPVGEPGELCSAEKKLEEVKKALELHADCETDNCFECPYEEYLSRGDGNCVCRLVTDALAILREQRAEIERLQSAWLKAQMDAEQERFRCKNICEPTYKNLLEIARAENVELVEYIQQCMYYAKPKNNNTCNFCKRDGGEGGRPCKGREDWVDCSPIWRGVVREKMEGEG